MLAQEPQYALDTRPTVPLGAMAFPSVLWAWLCWTCAGDWTRTQDYAYGWFVPPLAIYFFWKRLRRLELEKGDFSGIAWVWITLGVVAICAGPVELLRMTPIYWRPLLWAIYGMSVVGTLACARLLGGTPLLRAVIFPSIFMALAVPWPAAVEHAVTYPLMIGIASFVSQFLLFFGVPAIQAGTTIQLPGCIVGIEEACSGIRSLQASLMIALALGELRMLPLKSRAILLVVGIVFALLGNILRTLFLSRAGIVGGTEMVNRLHDTAGVAVLLFILAGLGVVGFLFRPAGASTNSYKSKRPDLPPLTGGAMTRLVRFPLFFMLLGLLAAHLWFFFGSNKALTLEGPQLSAREESQTSNSIQPMPQAILDVLRPTSARYILPADGSLSAAYHLYWKPSEGNAAQMYHRPDICMPGAGWQPTGKVNRVTIPLGQNTSEWYIFPFERGGQRAFLIWLAWMDDTPVRMDFNRNIHLQREMFFQFLRSGRREFQYEVAAVLIYYPGQTLPAGMAEQAVNRFFKPGEGSDRN